MKPVTKARDVLNICNSKIAKWLVEILEANTELCVTDLIDITGLNQVAISQRLKLLRDIKLVNWRRSGRNVWYSVDHKTLGQIEFLSGKLEDLTK